MRNGVSRRFVLMGSAASAALALSGCAGIAGRGVGAGGQDNWAEAERIVASIRGVDIPARSFAVADHGLPGSGLGDARPAIQAAIESAHEAGGGKVILPDGLWLSDGPVILKSNVELHLSEGAHLRFLPNPESYLPAVRTRWEGTEVYTYSPFIHARGQENIAITGGGTIDGQGEQYWLPWRETQDPIKKVLRDMGRDGVPVEERVFIGERRLRPYFVQFWRCERILIDGPTFVDSPFWLIHPLYCSDVVVRNITCVSRHINSDGVDPDSSRRVLIEDCDFDVGDDGVAIKSGRDQDGWRVGIPSEDIVIRRCRYLGSAGGAVAIGSEMSGGARNVYIEDWQIAEARHTLYFKANLDRGGFIENVHIRNIRAGSVDALIIFTNDYHSYRGGQYPPSFRDMTITDVRADAAVYGITIKGHRDAPVQNIAISDVRVGTAERPLELTDTEQVRLDDVVMNGRQVTLADAVDVRYGKKM